MELMEEIKSLYEVPLGKALLMLISYVANLVLNVPYSFSAYADAIKAQFNMTQTQVTITEAALVSTSMFLLPVNLLYDTCGIVTTSLVFLLVNILAWTSMWLCIIMRSHLIGYPAVISVAMTIAGHGWTYLGILTFVYLPELVGSKYRPFLMASSDMIQQIGMFLTSLTYETFYIDGHVVDAENQSLASFFLLVLIIYTVISGLWAVALPLGQRYRSENLEEGDENGASTELQGATEELAKSSNKKAIILDKSSFTLTSKFPLPFLLILASTAVPVAILYFQCLNVSYMTRSLSLVSLNYFLVSAHRICTLSGKLLLYLVIYWGRRYAYINEVICVILSVLFVIFQVLYLVKGTEPLFFCLSYVISNSVLGCMKLAMLLLLNVYYEKDDFGFKVSFAWSLICALLTVLQITFGALYDSEIPAGSGQYCYGPICLTNIFILTTACSVISPIASIALFYIKYRRTLNVNDAV